MPNYYALLGIDKKATQAQIREAYIRKALASHPDRNASADAADTFKDAAAAYAVLSDPATRLR